MENPLYEDCWHLPHLPLGTGEEEVERVSQEKAVGDQGETGQGLQKVLKKEIRGPRTHMTTGEGFGGTNQERSLESFPSNTAVVRLRLCLPMQGHGFNLCLGN